MFGSVGPTPYDLYFSLAGIPVRVNPSFWLVAVLMGRSTLDKGRFDQLGVWVACLFVSILVHELGHAVMARGFGWPPRVFLYHFGGLAVFSPGYDHTTGRSIAVSLAGPIAGFFLFGLVLAFTFARAFFKFLPYEAIDFAVAQLIWINLGWGLVNLAPVLPLDGGQVCDALCRRYARGSGELLAAKIGVVVGALIAAFFLWAHRWFGLYPAILFAVLCAQNVQTVQSFGGRRW